MTTMNLVAGSIHNSVRSALLEHPRLARFLHPTAWFFALLGFIALVSVHDAALLVVNQDLIQEFEQNPIGSWLIQLNNGSVWLFVILKLLGTSIACAVLASIFEYSRSLAMIIISPLASFQAMLLSYLYGG
ncbi:MAG: hypothetical protein U0930_22090 [Pirellulales bacterium]